MPDSQSSRMVPGRPPVKLPTIRWWLNGLIAVALVPSLLLLMYFASRAGEAERRVIEARRLDVTSNLSLLVDGDVSAVEAQLRTLAAELSASGLPDFRKLAEASLDDRINVIAVFDADGQQLFSTLVPEGKPLPRWADMTPFASVFQGQSYVSDIVLGTEAHRPVITIGVPVMRDGKVVYALSAIIYPERFVEYFAKAGANPNWAAAIVDRNGLRVSRNMNPSKTIGQPARPELIAVTKGAAQEGVFDNVTQEGIPTGNSFRRSALTGWTSVVSVPTAVLSAPGRTAALWMLGGAVAVSLLSFFLANMIARRLAASIRSFGTATVALIEGGPLPQTPSHIAELADIRQAYEHAEIIAAAHRADVDKIHFLMQELSHRCKNLLSVVQSIARQTARSSSTLAGFEQDFTNRLDGLRISHDLLANANWTSTSLAKLITDQVGPLAETSNSQLELRCADVTLASGATQSVGLALHELATNTAKYGAFSVPTGKVTISAAIAEDKPDRPLRLRWVETGGPPVEAPTRKGFGSFVTGQMVAQAVDGSAEVAYDPAGFRWELLIARRFYEEAASAPALEWPAHAPPRFALQSKPALPGSG